MFGFWGKKKEKGFDFSQLYSDMHSHFVPGIDDGAADLETSLELIREMNKLGFKKLITTPHIMWDMYQNTKEDILKRFDGLQNEIIKSGIQVEMGIAAEYFLDDHFKILLSKKEQLLTISKNLVLVEFSMANEPMDLKEILFDMQMQGYQPVIAHPERYIYNERNKDFFEHLKNSGLYFQLNIMSLAGAYGKTAHDLARYFIRNNYYEFAGTDLHNKNHLSYLSNPVITSELNQLLESGNLLNAEL